MSDTPRTDAEQWVITDCDATGEPARLDVVEADFARQLERENAELIGKFDYEAFAWALKKVKAFGCNNTEEGAMMTDRLEAVLR